MKILLVHPPITTKERYGRFSKAGSVLPPLGLLFISSYLKQNGIRDMFFIDGLGENITLSEFGERINTIQPDIVGITATTLVYPRAVETARLIKNLNDNTITVIGGPHAAWAQSNILQEENAFDFIIPGEGEHTFYDLVRSLDNGGSIECIDGLIYRKGNKIKQNPARHYIKNLDTLPFPDRDFLPNGWQYLYRPNLARFKRWPVTSIVSSRGCPFKCTFCDHSTFGNKFRAHSADYVIEEIEILSKKYGIKEITFEDDTFSIDKSRVIQICEGLIKKKIDVTWSCLGRIDTVDKKLLELMKRAGCWLIAYGLESGNSMMLKKMNKGINKEKAREVVSLSNRAGLDVRAFFIIGHPGETPETAVESIEYAKSLELHAATFCLMFPIPNTEAYKMAISGEYGKFNMDFNQFSGHTNSPNFIPNGFTKELLFSYQRKAYRSFYLRPSLIVKHIKMIKSYNDIKRYLLLLITAFNVFFNKFIK